MSSVFGKPEGSS